MKTDLSLTRHTTGGRQTDTLVIRLPVELGRALMEKGYNRVKLTVTDDGILLRPYVADEATQNNGVAEIPDWTNA